MNRRNEQQMFFCAFRHAMECFAWYNLTCIAWATEYNDELVDGEGSISVYTPRGSKFKNPGCVVRCFSDAEQTKRLLREYNPVRHVDTSGHSYFFFEEGQYVMAATGAAAALRKQQEGEVLR
jgi:hypothetical protein